MLIYLSFKVNRIEATMARVCQSDNPEEISKISQDLERANRIFLAWADANGGKSLNLGGFSGRFCISADKISELPKIKEQYEQVVGTDVSFGVAVKMSEADRALEASLAQGDGIIQLYTQDVDDILSEIHGLSKAEAHPDFEELFHQHASQNKPELSQGLADPVRAKIVKVLQEVRDQAPLLEKIRQSNPQLHQSIQSLVEAMIDMARNNTKIQPQDLDKAALEAGKTGHHNLVLPVGSQIDPSAGGTRQAGKIKVKDAITGKTKWRSVRAGMVADNQGNPTSARHPNPKTGSDQQ